MKIIPLTLTTVATCLIAATSLAGPGSLEALQQKSNNGAQETGFPAADVHGDLAGKGLAKTGTQEANRGIPKIPKPKRTLSIPTDEIRAVEGKDGKIFYLIQGGHFAVVGSLLDVWNRKPITTMDELEDALSTMDLRRMGFHVDKVNSISVGKGKQHVTVFVDTRCGWCHKLMKEIKDDPKLFEEYTFDFVIVALLGKESNILAQRLACAQTKDDNEKFDALIKGPGGISRLPQIAGCGTDLYQSTELQRRALNINSVPVVVAPDKRFSRGKPQNLRDFLDIKKAQAAKEAARKKEQETLAPAEKEGKRQPVDCDRQPPLVK